MLQISKVILKLEFTTPAILPYWMGSAFRGGFGQNLRRAICHDLRMDCNLCENKDNCLFYYTHMKTKSERGYAPPIKPIVLIPPFFGREMKIEKKARLDVEVLFFGDFAKYLPHVIFEISLFGRRGLYSQRYHDLNRFKIKEIQCCFSNERVYDGKTIFLQNLKILDAKDFKPLRLDEVKIGFKTPFTGKEFPPDPSNLLSLIRNRLIRFVNEYGDKKRVSEFKASGKIEDYTKHYHRLERRSMRSDKKVFHSNTGVVDYVFDYMDDMGAWILSLGFVIGCGPDSSFGCGFLKRIDAG